jgi:hypothetical protein
MGLLSEVLLLRRLPARDDLQEERLVIFDERHEVDGVLASDDENAFAGALKKR